MIKIFTQTDLIRYLYQETTEEEAKEISKALQRDEELKAQYADLCAARNAIDASALEQSSATVLNILSYSRSTSGTAR